MAENNLKPDENIFRFMFTTPSRFLGHCDGDAFCISLAFPSWGGLNKPRNMQDSSAFCLSFRAEPREKGSIRIERYEWVGDEVSALLGGFYGKLIQNLGHVQSAGLLTLPTTTVPTVRDKSRKAFNSEVRKPDGPELNLVEALEVVGGYFASEGQSQLGYILRAAEFYRVSLESMNDRPEIALAMFCSTLESLLPLGEYTETDLYDDTLKAAMQEIEKHCPNGNRIVKDLKSRLFQIKRRVIRLVDQNVPDSFFEERETKESYLVIKNRNDLLSRIKRVYDLRSKVVHTADLSGFWYVSREHANAEIGFGSPVMSDKGLAKTLTNSLTLVGLERVVSTTLRSVIAKWLSSLSKNEQETTGEISARNRDESHLVE